MADRLDNSIPIIRVNAVLVDAGVSRFNCKGEQVVRLACLFETVVQIEDVGVPERLKFSSQISFIVSGEDFVVLEELVQVQRDCCFAQGLVE